MKEDQFIIDAETLYRLCHYWDPESLPFSNDPGDMCENVLASMGLCDDADIKEVNMYALGYFRACLARMNPGRFDDWE